MEFFNKYEWLLFDLDNTLLDFSYSSKKAFEEVFSDVFAENLYQSYYKINGKYWNYFEKGKISAEELHYGRFQDFIQENNLTQYNSNIADNYLDSLLHHSIWIKGAKQTIEKYSKTHKLALITNGLSKVQHRRVEKLGLVKFFPHIFISEELNTSKPNQSFFEKVHHIINAHTKNKVLVVGDNPETDIKGGNQFGYDTCYFQYNKNKSCTMANYTLKSWIRNA